MNRRAKPRETSGTKKPRFLLALGGTAEGVPFPKRFMRWLLVFDGGFGYRTLTDTDHYFRPGWASP
jgi:hypothetical protein